MALCLGPRTILSPPWWVIASFVFNQLNTAASQCFKRRCMRAAHFDARWIMPARMLSLIIDVSIRRKRQWTRWVRKCCSLLLTSAICSRSWTRPLMPVCSTPPTQQEALQCWQPQHTCANASQFTWYARFSSRAWSFLRARRTVPRLAEWVCHALLRERALHSGRSKKNRVKVLKFSLERIAKKDRPKTNDFLPQVDAAILARASITIVNCVSTFSGTVGVLCL